MEKQDKRNCNDIFKESELINKINRKKVVEDKKDFDILNMLNSISNFEVFTPYDVALNMINLIPIEVFKDPNARFLDPAVKSGIFLREIIYKLVENLPNTKHTDNITGKTYDLSDPKQRVNHILRNMIYGIAISELTSYVTRRTLYGVMEANKDKATEYLDSKIKAGVSNIDRSEEDHLDFNSFFDHTMFNTPDRVGYEREGNIFYPNDETTIANEDTNHPFINDTDHKFINLIKDGKMKFDVIIGNPPYQVNIPQKLKGHTRAKAIYNIFIDKSIKLNPRFIAMITPSRWLTKSAAGISDGWVDEIINSNKIKHLYDHLEAKTCFNGVDIKGGVSYFLWDSNHNGKCEYFIDNKFVFNEKLNFLDLGFIVRDSGALSIIKKIKSNNFVSFINLVSPKNFFTTKDKLTTNWRGYKTQKDNEYNIKCYINKRLEPLGFAWIKLSDIEKNKDSININKVIIPAASGTGNDNQILGEPFLCEKNTVCSQTYLVIGFCDKKHDFSEFQCENIIKYIKTKFFRYMVSIKKKTQHAARGVYELVPIQDFNEEWTDEKLYKKYNLTEDEINHIEESIRPME